MNVGEWLKKCRKAKGMTQAELAKASGLSEISIRKYERGERKPKIASLYRLAEVLDISIEELFDTSIRLELQSTSEEYLHSCSCKPSIECLETIRNELSSENFRVIPDVDKTELIKEINAKIEAGKQSSDIDRELYYSDAITDTSQKMVKSILQTVSNNQILDIAKLLSYYLNFNEEGKKLALDLLSGLFGNSKLKQTDYTPQYPYAYEKDDSELYPDV